MITPAKLIEEEIKTADFVNLEKKIDDEIVANHGTYKWECAIVQEEYPISVRNAIAQRYCDAGWNFVYHRISSENEENCGVTSFLFSVDPIKEHIVKTYHCVSNKDSNRMNPYDLAQFCEQIHVDCEKCTYRALCANFNNLLEGNSPYGILKLMNSNCNCYLD